MNVTKDKEVREATNMQSKQEVTENGEGGVETSALFSKHTVPWSTISAIMDLFMLYSFIIYPYLY